MNGTSVRAPKSSGVDPVAKLSRMLQSMLRRWPLARVWSIQGGFGVSLDENTYVRVLYSGRWTAADMRDLHALFAVWLVADPTKLMGIGAPLAGVLQEVTAESARSNGQRT